MSIALLKCCPSSRSMNKYLSEYTNGKTTYDEMVKLCERDNFLTANQALEIGLIDKIVKNRKKTQ